MEFQKSFLKDPNLLQSSSVEQTTVPNKIERISISGVFNIETFATRLKEDITRYKSRQPWQIPDNSKLFESSSILNIVMQSFKDSSVMGKVEVSRHFIDDKKSFHDSDEKDTRKEMPSCVAVHHKDLNEILKKFADESIRIAVQNVDKKKDDAMAVADEELPSKEEKEITSSDSARIAAAQGKEFLGKEKLSKPPDNSNSTTNLNIQNKTISPDDSDKKNIPGGLDKTNYPDKTENKRDSPLKDNSFSVEDEIFSFSDFISKGSSESLSPPSLNYRTDSLLHKDIDQENNDLVEVRELCPRGQVKVRFCERKSDQDSRDERWQINILGTFNPTKVEHRESEKGDSVFQPPYSARYTLPRKSIAETHLQCVQEVAAKHEIKSEHSKHASLEDLSQKENIPVLETDERSNEAIKKIALGIVNKLWTLYDKLQESELFNGPPLVLYVRKNQVLEDAFLLLMTPSNIALNYYRFIKVYITDRCSSSLTRESMVEDQTEECFQQLVEGLFSLDQKSLFRHPSDDCDYLYPNPGTHSHPRWFEFAGVVLALSIAHHHPVKVKFPKCFFNCIFDRPLSLEGLEEMDPLMYQRLLWIKDSDISGRRISFSVKDSLGDESVKYGLLSHRGALVTEKNKFLYIERCLKWKLAENCLEQLKSIRRGFLAVLEPSYLSDFTDVELQQLCLKSIDELASPEEVRSAIPMLPKTRSF